MNILVIGSGGREHTIAWSLMKSDKVKKIYCAPGNAGIAQVAECVPIGVFEFEKLVAFAKESSIDLVFVGPDDPLALGIVDAFEAAGIPAFGPNKAAAEIEGSKTFMKNLLKKYNIPTAKYETFTSYEAALVYLKQQEAPMVKVFTGVLKSKGGSKEEAAAAIPARSRVRTTRPAQRTSSRARTTRSKRATLPARQQNAGRQQSPSGPRKSTPYRPPASRR